MGNNVLSLFKSDFLWSDPAEELEEDEDEEVTPEEMDEWRSIEFVDNDKRQISVIYGYEAIRRFLDENDLAMIVRAHEVVDDGYRVSFIYHVDYFYRNYNSSLSLPHSLSPSIIQLILPFFISF